MRILYGGLRSQQHSCFFLWLRGHLTKQTMICLEAVVLRCVAGWGLQMVQDREWGLQQILEQGQGRTQDLLRGSFRLLSKQYKKKTQFSLLVACAHLLHLRPFSQGFWGRVAPGIPTGSATTKTELSSVIPFCMRYLVNLFLFQDGSVGSALAKKKELDPCCGFS